MKELNMYIKRNYDSPRVYNMFKNLTTILGQKAEQTQHASGKITLH